MSHQRTGIQIELKLNWIEFWNIDVKLRKIFTNRIFYIMKEMKKGLKFLRWFQGDDSISLFKTKVQNDANYDTNFDNPFLMSGYSAKKNSSKFR